MRHLVVHVYAIVALVSSYFGNAKTPTKFGLSVEMAASNASSDTVKSRPLNHERCFVALKPDAIQRNLVGEIIGRFERKGLRLCAIKIILPDPLLVKEQYSSLIDAPFFNDIVSFFTSGPIIATVWEGERAVTTCRKLIGKTHPEDAEPGSIRGDFSVGKGRNLVHASDSSDAAKREIPMWFQPNEILSYSKSLESWMYSSST